jgi:hypothetical protein
MKTRALMAASLAWVSIAGPAYADTYEIRPGDDLYERLGSLVAGDEVIVHAGTYTQTRRFEATWAGTASAPILVRGADGEARPVLTRDAAQNLLNLHGSYFTLREVEIDGGSHGIRLSDVDHATFEGLHIHDTGDVGISCNIHDDPGAPKGCSQVTVRRCEIDHTGTDGGTGEGMYLGCNDGGCVFANSVIEQNYVHDLGGAQADGIEIKGGSYGNRVRDNVVVRSNYPGITIYSFDPAADRTPNVVERNLVWHTNDNGIQVTGRAIVRNNIVVDAGASGIASQMNQGTPTELVIVHNTVVGAGDACLRANDWAGGTGLVVANNALYCEGARALRITSATSAVFAGNVGLGTVQPDDVAGFTPGVSLDADLGPDAMIARVYPPAGSALVDAGDPEHAASDDFDLRPRDASPDVGAYERSSAGMPAWLAREGFKELESPAPTDDGGVSLDAGASSDAGISSGGGASGGDGGAGADGGTSLETGGCGCRAAPSGKAPLALALLGVLVFVRRCRAAMRR